MLYGGASFDVGRLTKDDKGKIPLANPRPLVLRSNFQDEDRFIDHLGLTKIINDSLREASFQGRDATLIFVDAIEFPGAYSLAGRSRTSNDSLNVLVRIFKGEEKIGEFTVGDNRNALHQLIANLLQNTEKQINISKR